MRFRNIFFSLLLCLGFFTAIQTAAAETIVNSDIVVDTVWSKAMSPISIQGQTRNHTIIRVTSGATLTIEAGVEVRMGVGMDLQVTSECLRGYGGEACYRDGDGSIRLPRLIAKATADNPIVFTSSRKNPSNGDWGSVIIDAKDSEVEWVKFLYGGNRSKRAFIEAHESVFKNNTIAYADTVGLWVSSQNLDGNSIHHNNGNGIYCSNQCEITNNYIAENTGNGIELETLLKTKISGNFFYKNLHNGVNSESILTIPTEISNNYFFENAGGIFFERSSELLNFHHNNFLRNTNFAIKSKLNNRLGKTYPAIKNWFGIDTGSASSEGEFFVSSEYITTDFAKDGNDFNLSTFTKAGKNYQDYLVANNLEKAFFQAQVKREVLAGNTSLAGSLLKHSFTFSNLTTKATGIVVAIGIPTNQEILLCSAKIEDADADYSLAAACQNGLPNGVSFSHNQLIWQPTSVAAQKEKTLYFVTALKPTATAAQLPTLKCNNQAISYSLGSFVDIGKSNIPAAETPVTPAVIIPTPTPAASTPTPVIASNSDNSLAEGVIYRDFVGGVLRYLLKTDDGKYYMLFNSAKWREIDDFTKSNDKRKRVAVWGSWYHNIRGVITGIKFTDWEIR
jgi:hypothetical protein